MIVCFPESFIKMPKYKNVYWDCLVSDIYFFVNRAEKHFINKNNEGSGEYLFLFIKKQKFHS